MDTLEERVYQFETLSLPGQPQIMHVGTSNLVRDLLAEIKRLRESKEYPETHNTGHISVEMDLPVGMIEGDIGVQIAESGKVWVCINGQAAIRFNPHIKGYEVRRSLTFGDSAYESPKTHADVQRLVKGK